MNPLVSRMGRGTETFSTAALSAYGIEHQVPGEDVGTWCGEDGQWRGSIRMLVNLMARNGGMIAWDVRC